MQERSSHKAMTAASATVKQDPNDAVYIFTGEGVRPPFATRASSREEAEERYNRYAQNHQL